MVKSGFLCSLKVIFTCAPFLLVFPLDRYPLALPRGLSATWVGCLDWVSSLVWVKSLAVGVNCWELPSLPVFQN